jgi:large subunit ribosomal protein L19
MNIVQQLEAEQLAKATAGKRIDAFEAGDIVRVNVRIIEGNNERIQAFEGLVIAKKNAGINSSVTVRKVSHGEGVERIFPTFSPRLDSIEKVRGGEVRRAKLYYLRGLTGRAARIKEKRSVVVPGATDNAGSEAQA